MVDSLTLYNLVLRSSATLAARHPEDGRKNKTHGTGLDRQSARISPQCNKGEKELKKKGRQNVTVTRIST